MVLLCISVWSDYSDCRHQNSRELQSACTDLSVHVMRRRRSLLLDSPVAHVIPNVPGNRLRPSFVDEGSILGETVFRRNMHNDELVATIAGTSSVNRAEQGLGLSVKRLR